MFSKCLLIMMMLITSIGTASAGINNVSMKANGCDMMSMSSHHMMMANHENNIETQSENNFKNNSENNSENKQTVNCDMDEQQTCCEEPCDCGSQCFTATIALTMSLDVVTSPINTHANFIYNKDILNSLPSSLERPPRHS